MADTTTPTRPHLSRTRAALLAALGLLGPGCGGEQAPEPPAQAAAEPPAEAPTPVPAAGEGEGTRVAESAAASHARKRFDLAAQVTAAPPGTEEDAPATLRGVARLTGKIPERQKIAMDHIGGCRMHEAALTETVLATESGELQNVVVYVTRGIDRDAAGPPPEEPVELVQEGCVFKPHISVVRAGQPLRIRNADSTNHNVNARPAHGSNAAFNKMQPAGAGDLEQVFARAEIAIPIGCDIHPWMKAWVAVVDHPYCAVSGEDGSWSIELPPGDYLVEAWHERYGTLKGSVQVGPGEAAEFAFTFEAAKKRE